MEPLRVVQIRRMQRKRKKRQASFSAENNASVAAAAYAYRILGKEFFTTAQSKKSLPLLSAKAFEAIDWPNVYYVLHHVPRLFQLFACKQVTGVAGTNAFVHRYDKSRNPMCPSCDSCRETTAHILFCHERNRQDLFR
jgi:hypothetical protein